MLAEIRLESRIKHDIAAIVEDQVQLDFLGSGSRHIGDVELIAIGRQQVKIGPGAILPVADCVRRQRGAAVFPVRGARFAPIGLPRAPLVAEPFHIGVAVL